MAYVHTRLIGRHDTQKIAYNFSIYWERESTVHLKCERKNVSTEGRQKIITSTSWQFLVFFKYFENDINPKSSHQRSHYCLALFTIIDDELMSPFHLFLFRSCFRISHTNQFILLWWMHFSLISSNHYLISRNMHTERLQIFGYSAKYRSIQNFWRMSQFENVWERWHIFSAKVNEREGYGEERLIGSANENEWKIESKCEVAKSGTTKNVPKQNKTKIPQYVYRRHFLFAKQQHIAVCHIFFKWNQIKP